METRMATLKLLACLAFGFVVVGSRGLLAAPKSPLLGKPLPDLPISHPVQGAAWSHEDLLGSVVVLDIFQLG